MTDDSKVRDTSAMGKAWAWPVTS